MQKKKRLDQLVMERFPQFTRQQVQAYIMRGAVTVDGARAIKSGVRYGEDVIISIAIPDKRYVSRAGDKLAAALETFSISIAGKVALDAGISTGGFTDCLLQNDIHRVYGIDVGYGQVHEKVASDPRVIVMERTNVRSLTVLPEAIDIVTLDLSFISVLKVLPAIARLLRNGGILLALIKPQFEGERADIGKGGIVRDDAVRARIVQSVVDGIVSFGFIHHGTIPSPVKGSSGNQEYVSYFTKSME